MVTKTEFHIDHNKLTKLSITFHNGMQILSLFTLHTLNRNYKNIVRSTVHLLFVARTIGSSVSDHGIQIRPFQLRIKKKPNNM
jgi:hypothetical protein